jgi:hypothetical protein
MVKIKMKLTARNISEVIFSTISENSSRDIFSLYIKTSSIN